MSRWRARPPATPATLRSVRAAQPAEVADLVAGDAGALGGRRGRRRRAVGGRRLRLVGGVWSCSWLQRAALRRRRTIGDDPDPARPTGPGSGSGRGRASWVGRPALCDDGWHDDHAYPRRPYARRATRDTSAADPRRRRVRPGPPPRPARAVGAGRRSWCRGCSAASASLFYAGLWLVLPADSAFETSAPGLESATPRRTPAAAGCAARRRRPGDRARPPSASAACCCFEAVFGQGALFWPVVLGVGGRRAAVAPGRRGPARALARHHRPDRPGPGRARQRRLGGVRPARRRPGAGRRRARGLRASRTRLAPARPRRRGRRRCSASSGWRIVVGPWMLPAGLRPGRRARRAGPHPGARRRRRPPARLGAADPGPDPEERRRRADRRPAGPRPGARPAVLAVRRARRPTTPPSPAPCAAWPPRSRTTHGVSVEVVTVGDCADSPRPSAPVVSATREA